MQRPVPRVFVASKEAHTVIVVEFSDSATMCSRAAREFSVDTQRKQTNKRTWCV